MIVEPRMTQPVDPQHRRRPAFDKDTGKTGQGYTLAEEETLGRLAPSGTVAARPGDGTGPDNGRRASFDPATGAVHGSGAAAGGGYDGEDLEDDRAAAWASDDRDR